MVYTKAGLWILLTGVVVLARQADCLRGSALVAELKNKAKAALLNPTETVEEVVTVEGDAEGGNATNVTVTKTKSLLTGNPQKDYIYDPNLPRELNGYNLTNYPFYNGVPEDIDFKCDDLHDGFYASVPHKCQVYHHCLFGTRYDFLCANYTAFDQRTFICHFVSEVDCDNSPKFYQRNEALYKAASTAPPIVLQTTTTTTQAPTTAATQRPRRRRPYRRRRPAYEYYYDDQYDDEEYYDDDLPPPRRKMNRKHRPSGGYRGDDGDDYYEGRRDSSRSDSSSHRGENSRGEGSRSESSRGEGGRGDSGSDTTKDMKPTLRVSGPASGTVYDKPRVPPKIRRPVPIHERDKYDYTQKPSDGDPAPTQDPKKASKPQNKHEEYEDEYYDDEYEDDYVKPPPKRNKGGSDYSSESGGKGDSRRPSSRHRPRPSTRRRPDRYDDDYEEDRPVRPRKRLRYEDPPSMNRGNRGGHRGQSRDEPDPVPADRPGFISNGRYPLSNRKRTEDDRSTTTKRPPSKVVYDDEEDDEEYYDDEEDETQEEDVSRRNHKPLPPSGGSGRRNENYEPDTGRKQPIPNRKPSSESSLSKANARSEARHQNSGGYQGEMPKSENEKPLNRQKFEPSTPKRVSEKEECKRNCEEDYLDYSLEDSRQEQRRGTERDNSKQSNQNDNKKQSVERERPFSSRFRDSISDTKPKQQTFDNTGPGKKSTSVSNYRLTNQSPEQLQRQKPNIRTSNSDELVNPFKQSSTTTEIYDADYSDEGSTGDNKYSNFRSKGRVAQPTPPVYTYKTYTTSEEPQEVSKMFNKQEFDIGSLNTEEPEPSSPKKTFISPRPFSGLARRPAKITTESTFYDELPASTKEPSVSVYRQPSLVNNANDKTITNTRNPINNGQSYRRFKVESPQTENSDHNQSKQTNSGNSFKIPVEETGSDDIAPQEDDGRDFSETIEENTKKPTKPFTSDKSQLSNPSYGGAYRRVKVSAMTTSTTPSDISTPTYEQSEMFSEDSLSNPVNNYKRPYIVGRPLNNYPVVVEDSTKNTLSPNNPFRRPLKQNTQESERPLGVKGYNPTSTSSGIGESYIKVEHGLGANLRPSLTYFPPKRGKIRVDDTTGRGLDQYPKQFNFNQDQFSKQTPKIEVTAPGPSAPGSDISPAKSNYNNASPGFPLDIPEEEYDVTLNDALQPSTLHPTRSLVDYQQNRLKTRDYQSNLGRTPEYVTRGRVAFLVPAASQQYITRVQSVYTQEKQEENPMSARYTDDKGDKKGASVNEDEYEAVVLSAPSDHWTNQRRHRPTEWYW